MYTVYVHVQCACTGTVCMYRYSTVYMYSVHVQVYTYSAHCILAGTVNVHVCKPVVDRYASLLPSTPVLTL